MNVQVLTKEIHDSVAQDFSCGNIRLDNFLKGAESLDAGIGRTYVYLSDSNDAVIGYYNLTTGVIADAEPPHMKIGGSIHINCFALDSRYQSVFHDNDENGKDIKLSDILFMQCIDSIFGLRKRVGFAFITLIATKQGYNLYKRADFSNIEEDMVVVEDWMEEEGIPMYYAMDIEDF